MMTKLWAALVVLLHRSLTTLLMKTPAAPRVIEFSEHQFVKNGHGKVLSGGRHASPLKMLASVITLALARVARPALTVAAIAALFLVASGGGDGGLLLATAPVAVLEKLETAFDDHRKELKATLDKQDAEIQANGASSSETAKRVEALDSLIVELKAEIEAHEKDLAAKIEDLETEVARPSLRGAQARQTAGQRFVESDQYKTMVENNEATSQRFEFDGSLLSQPRAVDSGAGSGGALIEPHRDRDIVRILQEAPVLRDLLRVRPIGSNSVEWVEQTGFTNNAAPTAESTAAVPVQKPKSDIEYTLRSSPVQTIAHWMPASRQVLSDALQLRAEIDDSLRVGLRLEEENQVLFGTGASPQIQGITTHGDVQTYARGTDVATETKIDAIRRAILRARLAKLPVTGIVLNPNDWADIELTKDSNGRYIWVQVPDGGVMRLWRVPIVESELLPAETAVVGAWSLGATLWDREQGAIRVSESHGTFFIENQVAILAEERVALAIRRPEAFVVTTLTEPAP